MPRVAMVGMDLTKAVTATKPIHKQCSWRNPVIAERLSKLSLAPADMSAGLRPPVGTDKEHFSLI